MWYHAPRGGSDGNPPAFFFNNVGAGIEDTVNKAAAGNDVAFAVRTGLAARALIGLPGNDDFSFKAMAQDRGLLRKGNVTARMCRGQP